jgi:hypothetical protein
MLDLVELSWWARHPSDRNQLIADRISQGAPTMKFTLTRTVGLTAAVAVLAAGGIATVAVAGTTHNATRTVASAQTAVPALEPSQVKYEHKVWGDPKTEVGIYVWGPKDWPMVKLSTFEAKFTSPNKLWNVRVNGRVDGQPTLKKKVDDKVAALHGVTGFKLISRVNGTMKATNPSYPDAKLTYTTLTYTYTDGARGTRLVVDRFVAVYDATHTTFEISTGGRPQDRAGLDAITAKVTQDYICLP